MSALSPTSTLQGSRYQILRTLGQGGFGITYQAQDALLQRKVVIKELFPQGCVRTATGLRLPDGMSPEYFTAMQRSFVGEARALAKFQSEHVVRVQDVFQDGDTAYIVMDFIEGRTLMQRLLDEGPLAPDVALRMAGQLAGALGVVHGAGLLHRDIKPDNIFLTHAGTPVLIDFGAAREYAAGQQVQMSVVLTHGFAPIEQYSGTGKFGPYTDLYALAATLLFAITAKLPPVAVARLQESAPLPPIDPIYAPGLRKAIEQALRIQPAERPQTAEAFTALLSGGRDDYGALELAQAINARYLATPPAGDAAFQRLWAQTLLALWSRREGHLPALSTPAELEAALERAMDVLPLLQEGFELIFEDLNLAASELARLLPRFVAGIHAQPDHLPDFAASVEALAALPKPVDLVAPGKVWRAPVDDKPARPALPALSAKFQGFRALPLDAPEVVQLAFAEPAQAVWTLSAQGEFQAFRSTSGAALLRVQGVSAAAGDASGLYTATHGGRVQRWDFQGMRLEDVVGLAFVPTGLTVAAGTVAAAAPHGEVILQQGATRSALNYRELVRRDAELRSVQFSADGQVLILRDTEALTLLRVGTLKVLRTLTLAGKNVTAAALTPDSKRAATAHGEQVLLWDVVTGREVAGFTAPSDVHSLFFNPGGRMLGVLGDELLLYDAQSGKPLAAHAAPGGRGLAASITRDGRMVAVAGLHRVDLLHLAPAPELPLPDLEPPARPAGPAPAGVDHTGVWSVQPASQREKRFSASPLPSSTPMAPASSPFSTLHAAASLLSTRSARGGNLSGSNISASTAELGVQPYREHTLPLQPQVDPLRRSAPELTALMQAVVQTEGPVHSQEVFRRLCAAHGLAKVGPRIAAGLEQVLTLTVERGLVVRRGAFLWPPGMTQAPVRNRSTLGTRSADLVCDEELQAALQLVQTSYPHQTPAEQAVSTARLLGFARLTEPTRQRITAQMTAPLERTQA